MTYMTEAPTADQSVSIGSTHPPGQDITQSGTFRLRRFGARPMVVTGAELGMAMSFTPEIPYWFEVNLYRGANGGFAVAVKQFFQSSDETDIARAWTAETLDEACNILESFDPAHDVPVGEHMFDPKLSAAELQAASMALQAQVADVRAHYRSLVGEFFFGMEQL